ncbi:MAG: hypothetical protein ACI37Q_04180 [Candidatus Gastranaerophilaceae bacterium]
MSFKDIKNLIGQNGNISLDKLNSTLKNKNASQESTKVAQSIFTHLDKNKDGNISAEEWENLNQDYENLDANQDGVVDENEIQNASENSLFKAFGNKVNEFVDFVKQSFTSDTENVSDTDNNPNPENEKTDTQKPEIPLAKSSYQTYKNGDSETNILLYNEDEHFELKATNFKPNSNSNFNVKNLNIINNNGTMLGEASYIVNGDNSTTAYGIHADNIDIDDPDNKKLDIHASVNKSIKHKSDDETENIDYGADISSNNLNLTRGKNTTNDEDGSSQVSNYTINANLKDLGNFDAKHTLTNQNDESTITNTQSIGMENDDISASVEEEKTDNDGNINTKKADATYNKETKNLNLDLSNSLQTNDGTRTNSLNLNSATDELNTKASFEHTSQDSNGNSSTLNLGAGYNEDLGLNAQHSKVKKRDNNTMTNTQTANFENDLVSLSLTNNSADNDGNVKNKKAATSYNTDSGAIDLNFSKDSQNE